MASISARGRPSIRARACRSLSASPIQQPPYSRHLHIFIMQNANAVVLHILTNAECTFASMCVSSLFIQKKVHIDFMLMSFFYDHVLKIILSANHWETLRTEEESELSFRRRMNAHQKKKMISKHSGKKLALFLQKVT